LDAQQEICMLDVIFIIIGFGLLGSAMLYGAVCERL
jgi:hypothetical protein